MRIIDLILTAFRNVRRQKLRSVLTIFAVVIGATSVTIMLALVTGARGFFVSQFEANGTFQQIRVSPQTDISWNDNSGGGAQSCQTCIKLTDPEVAKVAALPHVAGVARVTQVNGFQELTYNNQKLRINQVEASDANSIDADTILAGRDIQASDTTGVMVITSDYADKLGFKGNYRGLIGKKVDLVTGGFYNGVGANVVQQYEQMQNAQPGTNPGDGSNQSPTTLIGTVVGIMDTSSNNQTIRVPLAWARGMEEQQQYQVSQAAQNAASAYCQNSRNPNCRGPQPTPTLTVTDELAINGYDSLTIKADSTTDVKTVVAEVKKLGLGAADAQSSINSQLELFNIISYVLGGIGGIALLVAAIGVVNTMVMAILERTREIGVMRACGATRNTIRWLFTIEAAVLGFLGGVLGVLVGYGLTYIANIIINQQLATNSLKANNIITLPVWLIVAVVTATTIIGMLAGLYPAIRASRLNPVEALRYE